MFQSTRLLAAFGFFWNTVTRQVQATSQNVAFHLFCIVLGFFCGNLFGTLLNTLRTFLHWDLLIIFVFIGLSEFVSFQTYKVTRKEPTSPQMRFFYWRPFNLVKLGCLFGFFVDAFKVGS